ncbi:hypothetical protein SeLEV6574_g06330 [Synchytrium endobioticum]|nr:hypothetical protein SeLEV6574_g06330 [Synchytrium endobioticum]
MTNDAGTPRKLTGYEFYRKTLGAPKYIVAPMVDQSEYAWRMLSRRYGAQLCYTPMLHAKLFSESEFYATEFFTTGDLDRPLIVQFCANDPEILLKAAKKVEAHCDAVDINLGCPQGIAKKGHYGAFLMEKWDVVAKMVKILHDNLSIPVTCKIRVFPDVDKTIQYAQMIEQAGCQLLTVHGRLREQKGQYTGLADWEQIRRVKQAVSIPVFANGNILYFEDIQRCLDATGVDGVMSAEGNLYNPALFANQYPITYEIAQEFLDICRRTPKSSNVACVKGHLFKIFRPVLNTYVDLRSQLGDVASLDDCQNLINEYRSRLEPLVTETETTVDERGYKCIPEYRCQPYIRTADLGRTADDVIPKISGCHDVRFGSGDVEAGVGNGKHKVDDDADGTSNKRAKHEQFCSCGTTNLVSGRCTKQLCKACCNKLGVLVAKASKKRTKKHKQENGATNPQKKDEPELIDWLCESHRTKRGTS